MPFSPQRPLPLRLQSAWGGRGTPTVNGLWWLGVALIWSVATAADRCWLRLDRRLPSWDQADYLNSALDHGRALGWLSGGHWQGWSSLLDLSPKIPPLASLVNGTVMAITGEGPDQASWALAMWHALLLVVVACWGKELEGRGFGLLCAALVACTPALAELRVDFTLDMAVAASACLALWLLGRWHAPPPHGGRWQQAMAAALSLSAALLVKQSALLLVALPAIWAAVQGLRQRTRRLQVVLAFLLVMGLLAPWLRHNWITTLGGTERAVLESAAQEGDPAVFSLASLLWYPKLLWSQLGPWIPLPGALGLLLAARWRPWSAGWPWLIGCLVTGWICTTLSPNKDARYIAPALPLLLMLLARGWWQVGREIRSRFGASAAATLLGAALLGAAGTTMAARSAAIQRQEPAPVAQVISELRRKVGDAPTTLLVVPGHPELNEQTVSTYGRLAGGRIEGRRLGRRRGEHALVLTRSDWILLATGDQGTTWPASRELSQRVRQDGRFKLVNSWPWTRDRRVELWRRRSDLPEVERSHPFDQDFIGLARGMEHGPSGLARVFQRIGAEHQVDGNFLYQQRVKDWSLDRLTHHPEDEDALWSLALLSTLRNRPEQAAGWYGRLQQLHPDNPWPVAYRATVLLAGWMPWRSREVLRKAPESVRDQPVVRGLRDLSDVLSGDLLSLGSLRRTLPRAIGEVNAQIRADQTK